MEPPMNTDGTHPHLSLRLFPHRCSSVFIAGSTLFLFSLGDAFGFGFDRAPDPLQPAAVAVRLAPPYEN
jgi:hypothetical protein